MQPTNNNKYPVSLEATLVFNDSSQTMIDKDIDTNYYFAPGAKCAMFFDTPRDSNYNNVAYDSYNIIYKTEDTSGMTSNLSDIKTSANIGADNVMVTVTNSGQKKSSNTKVSVIFYKNGTAVGYGSDYADVGVPGSSSVLKYSFPHDDNYDAIQIDNYEIYVDNSYKYGWQ